MAYTEPQRVEIRKWLGFSGIYFQNLELAITASQSTADGGVLSDSTTETSVVSWLAELALIETAEKDLRCQAQVLGANAAKIDVARGQMVLRKEARKFIGHIADALNVKPIRDVMTAPEVGSVDVDGLAPQMP